MLAAVALLEDSLHSPPQPARFDEQFVPVRSASVPWQRTPGAPQRHPPAAPPRPRRLRRAQRGSPVDALRSQAERGAAWLPWDWTCTAVRSPKAILASFLDWNEAHLLHNGQADASPTPLPRARLFPAIEAFEYTHSMPGESAWVPCAPSDTFDIYIG